MTDNELFRVQELHKLWVTYGDHRGEVADLRGADLRGMTLKGDWLCGFFQDADFRGADLTHANFWGARLRGADLRGAKLPSRLSIHEVGDDGRVLSWSWAES